MGKDSSRAPWYTTARSFVRPLRQAGMVVVSFAPSTPPPSLVSPDHQSEEPPYAPEKALKSTAVMGSDGLVCLCSNRHNTTTATGIMVVTMLKTTCAKVDTHGL